MANMEQASVSLPPLSSTYQSSYLWAPHHLQRLTIDQRHYHNYVSHSVNAHPPHLNVLCRRVQSYGDNHFHIHRNIPVQQNYTLTALRLSNLRPADQLLDRPMSKDSRVVGKEVPRPFPAEHPYTSHISRFSVFPDTHTSAPCDVAMATDHTYRSVGTQTVLGTPGPYYVTQKAFEKGSRIERHWQLSGGHVTKATDHMTQQKHLWDFPRSLRHQRSMTYPAPKQRYFASAPAVSPHRKEALDTIHSLVGGTTSYTDHYSPPTPPEEPNHTTARPVSTVGDQHFQRMYSSFSHSRPYTAESRSKYKGSLVRGESGEEWEWAEPEEEVKVLTRDAATQTELEMEDEQQPAWTTDVPHLTKDQTADEPRVAVVVEPRPLTAKNSHRRSLSVGDCVSFRPRSTIVCRRFSQIYSFSRSNVMRQFHSQYPEPAPDLRQFGIQTGKRHTIHGYNAYYFH